MGMAGAAIATVIGSCLTVFMLAAHFFTKKNQLKWNFRGIKRSYLKEIILNGTASFLIEIASGITIFVFNLQLLRYVGNTGVTVYGIICNTAIVVTCNGTASFLIEIASGITIFVFNLQLLRYVGNTGVTVYGIICNTAIVVTCLSKGVNQAAQPILSINYGAGLKKRTGEVQKLTMITSLIVCGVIVLIGVVIPDFFTYIFLNPDKNILAMSGDAVRIYFIGFLFMAVNMVYICYFQAIVKNSYALLLCLLRGCILVLVFVYVLVV